MSPRTILITGANTGIGLATAQGLSGPDVHLILACRNLDRAQVAKDQLLARCPAMQVDLVHLDLSSLDAIDAAVDCCRTQFDRIDVLINNAGVMPSSWETSADGFELSFAVNYLGTAHWTWGLLPLLNGSQAFPRIVNVSSMMHRLGLRDFATMARPDHYRPWRAYGTAKLALILFTYELARRRPDLRVNALHPGGVSTDITDYPGWLRRWLRTPEAGAATSIYLASSAEVQDTTGAYFVDCKPRRSARCTYDAALCTKLWEQTAEWCHRPQQRRGVQQTA